MVLYHSYSVGVVFAEEISILSDLIEKYQTVGSLTYRFTRKVSFRNSSTFYRGTVTLTPFKEFKVNFNFPIEETYIFDGETITIFRNNKVVEKEKVDTKNSNELKSLQLLTCFFIYYLSKPDNYKFVEKKGEVLVFRYDSGNNYRETLHFNKSPNTPEKILIEFADTTTNINFSNIRNISNYTIPTKILTKIYSKRDFLQKI